MEFKLRKTDLVTLIDEEDYEKIKDYKWYLNGKGYVVATAYINGERHKLRLQRFLMNAPDGFVVDHINRNKLDNRKENLRICTYGENTRNRSNHKGTSSKYKGVSFKKDRGTWRAHLKSYGITYLDKTFKNEEDAAKAYDKVAKEIYGEFAALNFPDSNL
jgi:hypothetical protein